MLINPLNSLRAVFSNDSCIHTLYCKSLFPYWGGDLGGDKGKKETWKGKGNPPDDKDPPHSTTLYGATKD